MEFLIVVALVVVLLIWIAALYNSLVKSRNAVRESWSGIDTELRRRYNLIPNLVAVVQGYANHEREVFERVTEARNSAAANQGPATSQARDENHMIGEVRRLFALAEAYPDLKADRNYLELQRELAHTEDRIQRARRFYNGNVRDLNNKIETIPTNVVASMFAFQPAEYFEIEDASLTSPPAVAFGPQGEGDGGAGGA